MATTRRSPRSSPSTKARKRRGLEFGPTFLEIGPTFLEMRLTFLETVSYEADSVAKNRGCSLPLPFFVPTRADLSTLQRPWLDALTSPK
jgi:hypothetical protein